MKSWLLNSLSSSSSPSSISPRILFSLIPYNSISSSSTIPEIIDVPGPNPSGIDTKRTSESENSSKIKTFQIPISENPVLTQTLVIETLLSHRNDPLSALEYFTWVEKQRGFARASVVPLCLLLHILDNIDLYASQPAPSPAVSSTFDFFAAPDPAPQPDNNASKSDATTNIVDPFAAVPLNNFDNSAPFGSFTSHTGPISTASTEHSSNDGSNVNGNGTSVETKPPPKKDPFQVKSGIWADSLSRGIIDLNISAPKKINLADVGIVGGLSDGSEDKDKGPITYILHGSSHG